MEPDAIEYWVPDGYLNVTTWKSGKAEPGQLYDRSYLEGKDKYSSFLGGNQPLCVIENPDVQDGSKILLIRDSYSDSLAPFLAQAFPKCILSTCGITMPPWRNTWRSTVLRLPWCFTAWRILFQTGTWFIWARRGAAVPEMSAWESFADFLTGNYEKLNFRRYDFSQTGSIAVAWAAWNMP